MLGGSIEYFFKREEVFSELFKLLFKNSKINLETIVEKFDTNTLPKEFVKNFIVSLRKELLKDIDFDKILADKELFISIQGISKDIEDIVKSSDIATREVIKIHKILEQRIGNSFSYKDFVDTYTKNATNNLSQVNFLGLGVDISIKRSRKNLQDIFVRPNFNIITKKNGAGEAQSMINFNNSREQKTLKYEHIFSYSDKLVVLGNPGSGKSILVKSIVCAILLKQKSEFHNKRIIHNLPFRMELRKYLAYKKENRGNILRYLASLLEEEYGINN